MAFAGGRFLVSLVGVVDSLLRHDEAGRSSRSDGDDERFTLRVATPQSVSEKGQRSVKATRSDVGFLSLEERKDKQLEKQELSLINQYINQYISLVFLSLVFCISMRDASNIQHGHENENQQIHLLVDSLFGPENVRQQ